jgi:hypothetical protein
MCHVEPRNVTGMRTVWATPAVQHAGNRVDMPPRIVTAEADGTAPLVPNEGALNQPYPGRDARREATRELRAANRNQVYIG